MKGRSQALRCSKHPFIPLAVFCFALLFWWEKTPLFSVLLSSQRGVLPVSPDILLGSPVTSVAPQQNVYDIDSNSPSVTGNSSLHNDEKQEVVKPNQNYFSKETLETDTKDTSVGSYVLSAPSQPQIPSDDKPSAFASNETIENREDQAVNVETLNISAANASNEDTSVGSYVLSAPSQPQVLSDDNPLAFASNETIENREDQAVNMETSNTSAANASKKDMSVGSNDHTPPSQQQILSDDTKAQNVPVNPPTTTRNGECNFGKGKWVKADNRPFYSGFECKQWLSAMWACRLTQRTDFAYEKFRWKPGDCELEEFDGAKFLERMKDKTLALVGDSLGRQQYQSLMCMITGGKYRDDVKDVGEEFGLIIRGKSIRPDGWAYRFPTTNTTIVFYWSSTLCDIEPIDPSNPSTEYAMHLDRPPAFLRRFFHQFDVIVLNTGHHWNRGKVNANKWVMYVDGHPNTNKRLLTIGGARHFAVHSIIRWVDSQLTEHPNTKAFLRSISPRHFFNGDWNTGGTCDNTNPLSKSMEVLNDVPSDRLTSSAVKGTKVKLLDITGPSEVRDEGHISRYSIKGTPGVQDCLHWCLPGVPDTWNELLFAQL